MSSTPIREILIREILGKAHLLKVKTEQKVDEDEQEQQKHPEKGGENEEEEEDDDDQRLLSNKYKGKTHVAASLPVKNKGASQANEKTEVKKKRLRHSTDELKNASTSTIDQAKEFQANLDQEFPSFIKLMVRSHVTSTFWMGVPRDFYKQHLPQDDETVILIGENDEEYKVQLRASNPGLSGGWRKFSRAHKLQEGDVLIFQLVRPLKFKVHIVRRNTLVDGDLQRKIAHDYSSTESDASLGGVSNHSENCRKESPAEGMDCIDSTGSFVDIQNCSHQFENYRKDSHTESTDCFQSTESFVDLHSFSINVNGFALDSELSESVHTKYYELCFSRKSYLHDHLLKSIKPDLAAVMIRETVNIADEIQASGIFTSLDDYAVWDKTLKGFEILGMDVDFLRARLNKLLRLALRSGDKPEMKRYREATLKRTHAEEEITKSETALNRLKQAKNVLECEISTLKVNVQREELIYEEAARAPWRL